MVGSTAVPPAADPSHGRDELAHLADPVLQQVAGALGRLGEQGRRQPELHVLGQHQDGDLGVVATDVEGRLHPLVGVGGREPDVDDGDVGREAADLGQQLRRRAALGGHLEACVGEQPGEAVAQQDAVLGDGHPQHRCG